MPAPPMPTKWMRLTLCFMRDRRAARCRRRRRDRRRRRLPTRRAACAIASSSRASTHASSCGERVRGVELGLRHHDRARRASTRKRAFARLLVGDRARQRHDDRADADRGELGDRERAAAADDEVGLRVARGHVVDERHALGVDAGLRVRGAQRVDVPLAGLMHDARARRRAASSRAPPERARSSGCAPRLPPTTSSAQRARALREALRRAARRRRSSSRSGLPTHSTLARVPAARARRESRAARGRRRTRACDWRDPRPRWHRGSTSGLPLATPISAPGNDAKPPKPSTTSGARRRMIAQALRACAAAARTARAAALRNPLPRTPPKRHAFELDAVLRHEPRLHAVARAEPEHAPAARDELRRDGEPGKHVAAGAAGGDHHRAAIGRALIR